MNKILLYVCCAPDATHSINALREAGYEPVTYFYNPNIHPKEEYEARCADMEKLAGEAGVENIKEPPYDDALWHALCDTHKDEPERGRRCEICFRMRLDEAARKAKELGIEIFAATLTISPHKNAKLINRLGSEAAEKYGIKYYESDFKKKDGFKKSIELSKKHGLCRQGYCGCVFSKSQSSKMTYSFPPQF